MTDTAPTPADERYELLRSMPLEGIRSRLGGLAVEIDGIKGRYGGPLSRHRKNLRKEDIAALDEILADLFTMSTSPQVSEELMEAFGQGGEVNADELTATQINTAMMDVATFESRFGNTGVSLFYGPPLG